MIINVMKLVTSHESEKKHLQACRSHEENNLTSKGGGSTETTHLQAALHPHLAQQSQLPQDMMQLVTKMTLKPKARERLDEAKAAGAREDQAKN
jgi:phage terminase small subunit